MIVEHCEYLIKLRQHVKDWIDVFLFQFAAICAGIRQANQLENCRARFGATAERAGPFLFGAFGNADAMYAPVVSRFHTYAVEVTPETRAYMDAVMALPAFKAWEAAGIAEPWLFAEDEVDWPVVHRADGK